MEAGRLREAEEERAGDGIPKGLGAGRNKKTQKGGGNREYKVREAGNSKPLASPPHPTPHLYGQTLGFHPHTDSKVRTTLYRIINSTTGM